MKVLFLMIGNSIYLVTIVQKRSRKLRKASQGSGEIAYLTGRSWWKFNALFVFDYRKHK